METTEPLAAINTNAIDPGAVPALEILEDVLLGVWIADDLGVALGDDRGRKS